MTTGDFMNLFSDRRKIENEYLDWIKQNPEIKDCPLTLISFLEMRGYLRDIRAVGKPKSNRRYINELPNRRLAERLVSCSQQPDYVYNYDEELELWGFIDVYTTSDGSKFDDLESAIKYETWWLNQPHKEGADG